MLTSNVLCGVQAMSSTKSGRMTYGTYGEDEKFLIELLEQQNIRETDLKVTHRERHALSGGKPLAPHMSEACLKPASLSAPSLASTGG